MGERWNELESKLTFQEHALDTLDGVVVEHSLRIEQLERRLELLEGKLRGLGDGPEGDPLEERPPHH